MRPLILALLLATPLSAQSDPTFVSIIDVDPTIVVDARYHGEHNFIGRPIAGYDAAKCLLTPEAATALARVQDDLRPFGLGLKTYDCFRPQRAVDEFVRWAADPDDARMRLEFYPAVDKSALFAEGYIAERSGHSRGSTVDLTIVPLPADRAEPATRTPIDCRVATGDLAPVGSLDMGTAYDCFDPLSHTANPEISPEARANRLLLKTLMEKHGFTHYAQEWWHFTLADEPHPDRFFDVPVR